MRALMLLDSAAVLAPSYARIHFLRGDVLSTLYRFDEADEAFTRVLGLDPKYPSAAYRMGNNAFFLGQNRKALVHHYREIDVLDPRQDSSAASAVWSQIGRIYARLGVVDSARTSYRHAITYDAANDQAWGWMAELSEEVGELDRALADVHRAIDLVPDNPSYQYLAGALYYKKGEYALAIDPLTIAIDAAPWHAGAHYNLGRSLMALGRLEEGDRFLQATDSLQTLAADLIQARFSVRSSPEDLERWIALGVLDEQTGRRSEAIEAYRVARQLEEQN